MRVLAILGPRAREQELVPFRAAGAEIRAAESPADDAHADAVLVLGGDGTVQRHLAALVRTQLPLLVVPGGSGNDFARALGLRAKDDARRAWQRFLGGGKNLKSIDVGVLHFAAAGAANSPAYFGCAAGAGVDAEVARRANSMPPWLRGNGGYFLAALPALLRFQARPITVTATQQDGKLARALSEPGILAVAANAPWYGHGMRIAPHAELTDGQLEVCFVRRVGKWRLLRLFPKVYRGRHLGVPEVEYFRATRLRLQSESPLNVHADGELVGSTPVEISVQPRALPVIVG